ncbi:MAG: kua-ubiquitin conjugating enzyme hybrid localization domain protein [Rubrobacter sp.]|nr:kua-ubiquitin conjugating enzyme hybrid localization domain protein [Rubrobacter sp.]
MPRGQRALEYAGIFAFAVLAVLIAAEAAFGADSFGYVWLIPILAISAYLAADLASGFALDNFGDEDTPFFGPYFIKPFRDHHVDPKGITRNDFVDTNGNNCLASLPPILAVWLFLPMSTTLWGYVFGAFFLFLCLGIFLTNQFHKWAHMDAPPAWAASLQTLGLILSKEHHDIHHESPYDTYYCITVGVWNPLFDRFNLFERTERFIRRTVPGTHPQLRSEREGALNDRGVGGRGSGNLRPSSLAPSHRFSCVGSRRPFVAS